MRLQLCSLPLSPSGHIEQLPIGSGVRRCARGKTGREIRFQKTRKTEVEVQIELGRLLELARAGQNPETGVTAAELLDQYVPIAGWDLSTEESNLGYCASGIRIPPASAPPVGLITSRSNDRTVQRVPPSGDRW